MIYIYGLVCPLTGHIRYIGKSIAPEKRLSAHITGAVTRAYDHHTARWIRRLVAQGKRPSLSILQTVLPDEDWRAIERSWISRAKSLGWLLTNTTAGGEGLDYLDPEAEAKYRANHSAAMKRWASSERGRLSLQKMNSAGQTEAVKAKRVRSIREAWKDPEAKRRLANSMERVRAEPGYHAAKSEGIRRAWVEHRDSFMEAFASPQTKAKHSSRAKRCWSDPEVRERLMNRWTPEARERQAEEIRARMNRMIPTPEGRERQRQAMRVFWANKKKAKAA